MVWHESFSRLWSISWRRLPPLDAMLVCVECGEAVPHLYREFGKGNIRLTHCVCESFCYFVLNCNCWKESKALKEYYILAFIALTVKMKQEKCGQIADKYVEYEALILLYDMMLHKPSVYRHILYNRVVETSEMVHSPLFLLRRPVVH